MRASGRLTPHQQEVYERLVQRSRSGERWVPEAWIGCRGALGHLYAKGRVEYRTSYGPRGGEQREWIPLKAERSGQ